MEVAPTEEETRVSTPAGRGKIRAQLNIILEQTPNSLFAETGNLGLHSEKVCGATRLHTHPQDPHPQDLSRPEDCNAGAGLRHLEEAPRLQYLGLQTPRCGTRPIGRESHERLMKALGDKTPYIRTVLTWFNEFKFGNTNLEDELRSGRPPTGVTQEKIELVRFLLKEDQRITYQQLEKSVGIGSAAIGIIIYDHLKYRKLVSDETLIYNFDPETKRHLTHWCPSKLAHSKKVAELELEERKTVNSDWYTTKCLPAVFEKIKQSRPRAQLRGVLLHHENARPHTLAQTFDILANSGVHYTDVYLVLESLICGELTFFIFQPQKSLTKAHQMLYIANGDNTSSLRTAKGGLNYSNLGISTSTTRNMEIKQIFRESVTAGISGGRRCQTTIIVSCRPHRQAVYLRMYMFQGNVEVNGE
ncbi:hypothetical protein LAZ67_X004870 [Cordylochernes scorpioides]|uniref:Mos1 transposase HTH domain-containing protein n=1 Tax=Cordylochernes scorpioides TaxID=51811 RepID=A0ABY6LYM1_9ARAC|nr:hypothetical protein LAZ67_X004870 [Cordylochernes scorpioides]